jgi:hypothetical protein
MPAPSASRLVYHKTEGAAPAGESFFLCVILAIRKICPVKTQPAVYAKKEDRKQIESR